MNNKLLILLVVGVWSIVIIKAQDTLSEDHTFVNSVYKNHIKNSLDYYYLHHVPIYEQLINPLRDTLLKYISEKDLLFIKKQIEFPDTSFKWKQEYLNNCKVIQDDKAEELQAKNTYISVLLIDSFTGKPVKNQNVKDFIPMEGRQFYYFSKPIWNKDSTLVIFGTQFEAGNYGANRTYIYKKEKDGWKIISKIMGLEWIGY